MQKGKPGALFWSFFKVSGITFGGGLVMLPMIQREFVDRRQYMTDEEMVDCLTVIQSLPGIIAINSATVIGYRCTGLKGALAAACGVVLPPFLVILAVAALWRNLTVNASIGHAFLGIRAAVCAFILVAAIRMVKPVLKTDRTFGIAVALGTFAALVIFRFSAVVMILAGAAAGTLYSMAGALRKSKQKEPQS